MLKGMKIGVIGSGNMSRALIGGLLRSKHATKAQIASSDVRGDHLKKFSQEFGIFTTSDNRELVTRSDIVVLAIKPQVMDRVADEISSCVNKEKLLITIAAGVPIASLQKRLPAKARVVRVMPNIAALVDAGASAISGGDHASEEDVARARTIFGAVGKTVTLDEELMDAVTGLSGSGPAYIFLIIDALADAGVKVGLSREDALILAPQTVLGAAKLLIETGEHPGRLKDMVTSPGGTAISGIHTLEQGGLRTTLINAVERATEQSRTLGAAMNKKK